MVSQSHIVVANLVVAIAATIAVFLRFVSRGLIKSFAADDWLILAALPFGWGMAICTIIAVHYGLGQHAQAVPRENIVPFIQVYLASELIWACSMALIKISVLLLYVRIFGTMRYFRLLAYGFGSFTIAWAIMVVLVCTFQCLPVAYQWDKTIEGGQLSLIAIFCLGSLTCVFSLIRLVAVAQSKDVPDPTFTLGIVAIWSTAEPCLGIVSTCLPSYKPIITRIFGHEEDIGSSGASRPSGGNSTFRSKFNKNGSRVALASASENEDDHQLIYNQKELMSLKTYATASNDSTAKGRDIPMDNIHVQTNINSTWSHKV